jgi:hypothetical protein
MDLENIRFLEDNMPTVYWNGELNYVDYIAFTEKNNAEYDIDIGLQNNGALYVRVTMDRILYINAHTNTEGIDKYGPIQQDGSALYGHVELDRYVLVDEILPDTVRFKSKIYPHNEITDVPYNYAAIAYADWLLRQNLITLANDRLWYIIHKTICAPIGSKSTAK